MDRFVYFLQRTGQNLRSALVLNVLSLLTFAISMTIFIVYGLIFRNVTELTQVWNRRIQIHAYLKDGLKDAHIHNLRQAVSAVPGVKTLTYLSKEDAIREVRKSLGDSSSFLEGITANPFPASLQIDLEPRYRHPERIRDVVDELKKLEGIEDIDYGEAWVRKFSSILSLVRVGGYFLGLALFIGVVFIISNTIRLSFFARKEEIDVMKLVGATPTFVKMPFYFEGILLGGAGGLLGLAFSYLFYAVTSRRIDVSLFLLLGGERFSFFSGMESIALVALAAALGWAGSALSLARAVRFS